MSYILDADWIINALADKRNARTVIYRLAPQGLTVSVITLGEIYEGAFKYAAPQAHLATFRQFLAPFRLIGVTDPIIERFAEIRADLRRQGELIPDFDILLAATALHGRERQGDVPRPSVGLAALDTSDNQCCQRRFQEVL